MINWEVVLWTCITLAVIMGVIGLVLSIIGAALGLILFLACAACVAAAA